jgi:hypothetical protein
MFVYSVYLLRLSLEVGSYDRDANRQVQDIFGTFFLLENTYYIKSGSDTTITRVKSLPTCIIYVIFYT